MSIHIDHIWDKLEATFNQLIVPSLCILVPSFSDEEAHWRGETNNLHPLLWVQGSSPFFCLLPSHCFLPSFSSTVSNCIEGWFCQYPEDWTMQTFGPLPTCQVAKTVVNKQTWSICPDLNHITWWFPSLLLQCDGSGSWNLVNGAWIERMLFPGFTLEIMSFPSTHSTLPHCLFFYRVILDHLGRVYFYQDPQSPACVARNSLSLTVSLINSHKHEISRGSVIAVPHAKMMPVPWMTVTFRKATHFSRSLFVS